MKVSLSILTIDYANVEKNLKTLLPNVDYIHMDVMDGVFVPNISFGYTFIKSLRKLTNIDFDTHLMIEYPQNYIKQFISEKDVHKKIMITSTYNKVFDYIKSLKNLSRIGGIASMLKDKDYVRVIILIKLHIMKDGLEKIKQNNDSDYNKHI